MNLYYHGIKIYVMFRTYPPFFPYTTIFKVYTHSQIRVITKLPNSEQSNKGKVKTHKYINRQNQSTYLSIIRKLLKIEISRTAFLPC